MDAEPTGFNYPLLFSSFRLFTPFVSFLSIDDQMSLPVRCVERWKTNSNGFKSDQSCLCLPISWTTHVSDDLLRDSNLHKSLIHHHIDVVPKHVVPNDRYTTATATIIHDDSCSLSHSVVSKYSARCCGSRHQCFQRISCTKSIWPLNYLHVNIFLYFHLIDRSLTWF